MAPAIMRSMCVALLVVAQSQALQVDQGSLQRCIAKATPLNGRVLSRERFKDAVGSSAEADALYDAMTRGRGPTLDAADLERWTGDEALFVAAVTSARAYTLAVRLGFDLLQTTAYYVLFVASAARELLGKELLISRGAVEPLDAAVGLLVAYAAAYATTEGLMGGD